MSSRERGFQENLTSKVDYDPIFYSTKLLLTLLHLFQFLFFMFKYFFFPHHHDANSPDIVVYRKFTSFACDSNHIRLFYKIPCSHLE